MLQRSCNQQIPKATTQGRREARSNRMFCLLGESSCWRDKSKTLGCCVMCSMRSDPRASRYEEARQWQSVPNVSVHDRFVLGYWTPVNMILVGLTKLHRHAEKRTMSSELAHCQTAPGVVLCQPKRTETYSLANFADTDTACCARLRCMKKKPVISTKSACKPIRPRYARLKRTRRQSW